MLKLKLAAKVWFQGSQSQIAGGSSYRNGQTCPIWVTDEHINRWVLITPLGRPVLPEVSRILPMLSFVTAA